MKSWLVTLVLAVLTVGAMTYVVIDQRADVQIPPRAVAATTDQTVEGLKRAPGTWSESTINVGQSPEALGEPDVTIDIQVLRPVFLPTQIKVKKGQVVRLRLIGKDNGLADLPEFQGSVGLKEFSGHGFQILGPYDVWVTGIRKDEVKEVTFKASVAGEFPFECVVFCHPLHYKMQGKLIVEE